MFSQEVLHRPPPSKMCPQKLHIVWSEYRKYVPLTIHDFSTGNLGRNHDFCKGIVTTTPSSKE